MYSSVLKFLPFAFLGVSVVSAAPFDTTNNNIAQNGTADQGSSLNAPWYLPTAIDINDKDDGFGITLRGMWVAKELQSLLKVRVYDKEDPEKELLNIDEHFMTARENKKTIANENYDLELSFIDFHENGLGLFVTAQGTAYGKDINKLKIIQPNRIGASHEDKVEEA